MTAANSPLANVNLHRREDQIAMGLSCLHQACRHALKGDTERATKEISNVWGYWRQLGVWVDAAKDRAAGDLVEFADLAYSLNHVCEKAPERIRTAVQAIAASAKETAMWGTVGLQDGPSTPSYMHWIGALESVLD